jgi:hypothetical protein
VADRRGEVTRGTGPGRTPYNCVMHRFLPVLLAATVLLAACGSTPTPSAKPSVKPSRTTTAKPDPMIAWAGRFCGLDSAMSTTLPEAPLQSVGPATAADRQDLLAYLKQAKAQLTEARHAFAALSPAPTAAANAMLTIYLHAIDDALGNVDDDISATAKAPTATLDTYFTLDQLPLTLFQTTALHTVSTAVKAHPDLKLSFTGIPGCSVYTIGH